MNLINVKNYDEMSKLAAMVIAGQITEKRDSVLGLATGGTPEGTYAELVRLYEAGLLDFSGVKTYNLDEYVGLASDHAQSYHTYMKKHLFDKVNIPKNNIHLPDGAATNLKDECVAYEKKLTYAGGADLQLLGIGVNGHIGFNEPADFFTKGVVLVDLTQETIDANARYFEKKEDVPRKALSMSVAAIMSAKKILLVASGENKKEAIEEAVYGNITPQLPASVLQLHPNVTVIYSEK